MTFSTWPVFAVKWLAINCLITFLWSCMHGASVKFNWLQNLFSWKKKTQTSTVSNRYQTSSCVNENLKKFLHSTNLKLLFAEFLQYNMWPSRHAVFCNDFHISFHISVYDNFLYRSSETTPSYLHRGPPVLLNPERVVTDADTKS